MSVEFEKIASEGNSALVDELEKFASENELGFTREEIEAAVNSEEMQKIASFSSLAGKQLADKGVKTVGGVAGETLTKGLTMFGAGLGLTAGIKAYDKMSNSFSRRGFDKALDEVKRTNSIVRDADPHKVEKFANTIHRFAPTASTDPNLLASVLAQAVQYESMDQNTIKSLVELEARMQQMNRVNLADMAMKA